jgi:hypothetical protein
MPLADDQEVAFAKWLADATTTDLVAFAANPMSGAANPAEGRPRPIFRDLMTTNRTNEMNECVARARMEIDRRQREADFQRVRRVAAMSAIAAVASAIATFLAFAVSLFAYLWPPKP